MATIKELTVEYKPFILAQLAHFEQQLQPSSTEDEEVVRRASFAVRNKAVSLERFVPTTQILYAVVHDVRIADVLVDFTASKITCSCKQGDNCRHKLATLLTLYEQLYSVQEWTANWRSKRNAQLQTLATARTPENWLRLVQTVMEHSLHQLGRIDSYKIPIIIDQARSNLYKHMPFEHEWRPLYKLFVELTMLNYLWQHLNATDSPTQSQYFIFFIERTTDKVAQLTSELPTKARLFAADPFYDALQQQARNLLLQKQGLPVERLQLYIHLWTTVFHYKQQAEKEAAAFMAIEGEQDVTLALVPMLFTLLLKQPLSIAQYEQYVTPHTVRELLCYVQVALDYEHPTAATELLIAMLPHLQSYLLELAQPMNRPQAIRQLDQLYSGIVLTEPQQLQLYQAYGKFGVHPYSNYLLRTKQYREWVALHQLHPSSLAHLESIGLKTVIEQAPAFVLPLFHHYAMEEIRQKSRMNYKQAVRIWKMMKTTAKKAGKTTYFEQYMLAIQQQFKRLRALQEELDKSNLFT